MIKKIDSFYVSNSENGLHVKWSTDGLLHLWSKDIDPEAILNHLEIQAVRTAEFKLNKEDIKSYLLEPIDAINFLTLDSKTFFSSLPITTSLIYWRESSKYLLELLAKGSFVPSIKKQNIDWYSTWRPLFEESNKFKILSESMPLNCRLNQENIVNGKDILSNYLSTCSDKLIRSFIGDKLFLELPEEDELEDFTECSAFWLKSVFSRDPKIKDESLFFANLDSKLKKWSNKFLSLIHI